MTYVLQAYHPVVRLARQLTRTGKLFAVAERIQEALEGASTAEVGEPGAELPRLMDKVTWHDFRHRGPGGDRLGPLDLEVRRGQRVAVVGPCGSGKSTLLDSIVLRARKRTAGALRWDAIDLLAVPKRARKVRIGRAKALRSPDALEGLDVVVLDDTFDSGPDGARASAVTEALAALGDRTVFASMRRPVALEQFDCVVRLEAGRRVYKDLPQ